VELEEGRHSVHVTKSGNVYTVRVECATVTNAVCISPRCPEAVEPEGWGVLFNMIMCQKPKRRIPEDEKETSQQEMVSRQMSNRKSLSLGNEALTLCVSL